MTQHMIGRAVQPLHHWSELATVAWHRSWQFTGLFRRSSRMSMAAAAASWTWQWAVVAWQAAAQYPVQLMVAGTTATEIRAVGAASARIRRADQRPRVRATGLLLAGCTFLALFGLLLLITTAALLAGVATAAAALLGIWLAGLVATLIRPHSDSSARLVKRARELTDGPAVVVSDVVAGRQRQGAGLQLMRALHEQWRADGITAAVLYAGSDDLVRFYRDVVGGWDLDAGSQRRMIWTPGAPR